MKLSLIVAMTKNRVIGLDNQMPWHLPADLAWFKQNTLGKPVIMGRKTFESIGKPLPKRRNIVLSRTAVAIDGVEIVTSLEQALALVKEETEAMIIGGGQLFAEMIVRADRLYLTEIDTVLEGDTYFPVIDAQEWQVSFMQTHLADEKNPYNCCFKILERQHQ
ncbi:type 3 dihydrofolate reductase [Gallibacterium genomosp. 3]|uniref:Dihydrofolate reductase n=1 Tax=Gallibacterium genomosp. 3 TaxID=505345 RepID=A0A1A7QD18_9PAST|nr:type 3 dihydrofolate reductase [Gallibacterium genomosp. 3]OBX11832.1 dihydrofolate reductase [Gallibacterium genomosp. 3]